MPVPTLITFIVYLVVLLGIGLYFYQRNSSIEDYLLGGRAMGAWVTALSAQASDMSGWLLMGLPGAVYLYGIGQIWIAVGLLVGTALNWVFISARLRVYTQKTASITLPCFFEDRFADPTGLLRVLAAVLILVFFTIYASSGLVATGKLFESVFNFNYAGSVIVGGGIIIAYTFLGGFLAVCWTDLFQGSLMVIALTIVPIVAFFTTGGISTIRGAMHAREMSMELIPGSGFGAAVAVVSAMAWGLGYFGQPHILARFMSARSLHKLRSSAIIAIVWVIISLAGAVSVGLIAIGMFDHLEGGEREKVFILMISRVMHPYLAGIMLAAILSAIMSTIDSQLLVSSSALTEDFYKKVFSRNATETQVVIVGRACVIVISFLAMLLALKPNDTILGIVAYAWGGFGAAFGPLVLFALFSRRTTWQAALAGMVMGTVTLVIWRQLGLGDKMYEIVPGFAVNCVTIMAMNVVFRQSNPEVLTQFDEVCSEVRTMG